MPHGFPPTRDASRPPVCLVVLALAVTLRRMRPVPGATGGATAVRTAAVDPAVNLWISFTFPVTYVCAPQGEKLRIVQFRAAGLLAPTSLFFAGATRLLAAPGCYEFDVGR
jgi:hypothetical protein